MHLVSDTWPALQLPARRQAQVLLELLMRMSLCTFIPSFKWGLIVSCETNVYRSFLWN